MTLARAWTWLRLDDARTTLGELNRILNIRLPLLGQSVTQLAARDGLRGLSADRGDADVTLVPGTDFEEQRFATTLTADRTVTLNGGAAGDRFRVVRTGLGAFTLDVGGLKTIPSATAAFVDVTHDGTAWRLTGYGAL